MFSRPGTIRALLSLCAATLLLAAATAQPFFSGPARAHGPTPHGPVQTKSLLFYVRPPVSYKHLTLYPVVSRLTPPPTDAYITLDEGLRAGTVVITERSGERQMVRRDRRGASQQIQVSNNASEGAGATVNQLALTNKSGKKLLLLAGEVVVGGKQDRIVEEDLVVPPVATPISLSVFCVEHGRWSQRTASTSSSSSGVAAEVIGPAPVVASAPDNFSSLGAISHPKLRAAAQDKKAQGEVWREVGENNAKLGTVNSTDTYQMVYASKQVKATMDDYVAALQKEVLGPNVVGVVVARGGELFWVDQFASPSLFQKYWPKLLKSYIVEAMSGASAETRPSMQEAQRYLDGRAGETKSTVRAGVYELIKWEHPRYAVFELWDTSLASRLRLHYNKMQR